MHTSPCPSSSSQNIPQGSSSSSASLLISTPQYSSLPPLFLPPSGPSPTSASTPTAGSSSLDSQPDPPNPPCYLRSTQDLLSRFQLLPIYDKYVRAANSAASHATAQEDHPSESTPGDKGKGKQEPQTPAPQDGDDEDGEKGEKKKKNTYKHLIKAMPGKHSMKKDEYLMSMMQIPPKDRMRIRHFDPHTQSDAFSVSLDGLKGWNTNALVLESAQAREDRKKRRELKKLAKSSQNTATAIQPQTQSHPTPSASASTPKPSIPTPGSARPSTAGTPRPSISHPLPTVTQQQHQQVNSPRVGTPVRTSTPHASSPSAPIHRASAPTQPTQPQPPPPPVSAAAPSSTASVIPESSRGVKRDRDEARAIVGARAGVPGIRPRPIKKQRMDVQGTSMPIQQPTPTPQGV